MRQNKTYIYIHTYMVHASSRHGEGGGERGGGGRVGAVEKKEKCTVLPTENRKEEYIYYIYIYIPARVVRQLLNALVNAMISFLSSAVMCSLLAIAPRRKKKTKERTNDNKERVWL